MQLTERGDRIIIDKRYKMYAAHRNKAAGVKCGRIHGHTYWITFGMRFNSSGDVAMLFQDIDSILEPLVNQFDHYLLLKDDDTLVDVLRNAGETFRILPFETSAENLARYFFHEAEEHIPEIFRVSVKETQSSNVTYQPYEKAISK